MIKLVGKLPSKLDRAEYEKRTIYFKNNKFLNMNDVPLMVKKPGKREKDAIPKCTVPVIKQNNISKLENGKLAVYWLGHSSIIVQLGSKNILIDPILTKYASPFNFVGVKRFSDIPILPEYLPDIDVLLISHDHYDHLDYHTLIQIKEKIKHIIVPVGVESFLLSWGFKKEQITTLTWWQTTTISGIQFTATPSQHFSSRNPLYSNATWWCGFYMNDGTHGVYYSGDGGYTDSFKKIGNKFSIDLALLECGQYDAAWPHCHMFPEQTAQAALDLNTSWMIPVHWGAFCLCNASWNDSVKRVLNKGNELGIHIATPMIGECMKFDKIENYQKQWWK